MRYLLCIFLSAFSFAQVGVNGPVKLKSNVSIGVTNNVVIPTLTSVQVGPATQTVTVGAQAFVTGLGNFSDGSQVDLTSTAANGVGPCVWTSNNLAVATLGVAATPQPVNTLSSGSANITCTIGALSSFGTVFAAQFNIVPATLPNGFTGVAYSQTISTVGGVNPIAYTITSGAPPTGVTCSTVSNTFVCSGTPSVAGPFTFTVHAVDSTVGVPQTDDQVYTIAIGPPPVTSAQLPQNWVNPHQCDTARSAPNTTFTIPGTYTATAAGVIQAFTDAEAYREAHGAGLGNVKIVIAHGTSIQGGAAGFTLHGGSYTGTDCVWVTSDTPLRRGVRFGSVAISTISRNANVVTVVTLDPHQLNTNDLAIIENVTGGATNFNIYQDGGGVAITKVNSTTFTYPQTGPNESGTVTFPYTVVTGANGITSQKGNLYTFVQGVSNSPIINADQKAHHWVFEDGEFTLLSTVQQDTGVLVLGSVAGGTLNSQAFHIGLEQSYYHGCAGAAGTPAIPTTIPIFPQPDAGCGNETRTKELIRMLCGDCWVINSFGDQSVYKGVDSHVTGAYAGQGPMLFANDHLRGGSTTFHFGGAPEPIPLLVTTDMEVRMNTIDRDPNWRTISGCGVVGGRGWNLKNNWEFKEMKRALLSGLMIENNWCDGQAGDQALMTVRGDEYWYPVQDITFENNVSAHAYGIFEVLGRDQSIPGGGAGFSMTLQRTSVSNSVWYGLGDKAFARTSGTVRGFPQGSGTQNYSCTASRTANVVTLSACSCPSATCNTQGANKTGVSAGDWLNVNGCSDPTMNTLTGPSVAHTTAISSDPFTPGPVTYASGGVNGSGTCTLTNGLGWPNGMAYDHNTVIEDGPANGTNAYLAGNPSSGNFPMNYSVTNTIFARNLGSTVFFYGGNSADGSKSTKGAAGFDQSTLTFHHIAQSGGAVESAANFSDWSPVGVEVFPATTIRLNIPAACGGPPVPGSPTCLGFSGDAASLINPLAGDWHVYRLKPASFFATGNGGQSSDNKDLGADFNAIDNARILNQYVCATDCTQGGLVHGPYAIN